MLDIALRNVRFAFRDGFALRGIDLVVPRSTHTAIVGQPRCGASTLLRLISGELRPATGEIAAGARLLNTLRASQRPLLYATEALDVPGRWSVRHALVAAVRQRTLDRTDRLHEYRLAVEKWALESLVERNIATLSSSEQKSVHLARIELLRPAILIADRLLAHASEDIVDDFYRAMRIIGATVISAPASRAELAYTDTVAVLEGGRITQHASAAEVFSNPLSEAAAAGTGDVNLLPIEIRGSAVQSPIGSWDVEAPPFQGAGIALVRPGDIQPAARGEESDFVFSVEEAGFREGRWLARGLVTGGVSLRVALPDGTGMHKGKLLAMRYDPRDFRLIPSPDADLSRISEQEKSGR